MPLGNGRRTFHKCCGSLYPPQTWTPCCGSLHESELMIALEQDGPLPPVFTRLPVLSEGWTGFLASKWKERGGCCWARRETRRSELRISPANRR